MGCFSYPRQGVPPGLTFRINDFDTQTVCQVGVLAIKTFDNLKIDLGQTPRLVEPVGAAWSQQGTRLLIAIRVVRVNAVCAELELHGV